MITLTKQIGESRARRYRAEFAGMTEHRATAREARSALTASLVIALGRLATGAQVVRIGAHSALVEPTLYGWQYRVLTPALGCLTMSNTQESALSGAWVHVAQHAYDAGTAPQAIYDELPAVQATEIRHWVALQGAPAEEASQ